jgi:flagellin
MPITIGSNIASLRAQRQLSKGTSELSKTYERLSSGLRINRASDDAAGLAISASLSTDSRVFNQGVKNLNDGLSLLNIADSALQDLSTITTRLKELAEQAANGTYGAQQRKSLDAEAQALSREYLRIAQTTKFNGRQLFSGSFGDLRVQGGYGVSGGIQSGLGGAIGTGTFDAGISYQNAAGDNRAMDVADLNGDGISDLVASHDGQVTVNLGLAGGGFGTGTDYTAETSGSNAISLSDLNNDGILDLVTAGTRFSGGLDGYATIRLGRGDGTFGSATSYLTEGSTSKGLALGDLNGDGNLDLVTAGYNDAGSGFSTVRLGTGSGTFGSATSYATETLGSKAVKLNDLNHDGILDIITLGEVGSGAGAFTVRFGTGTGTFGTARSYLTAEENNDAFTLGDINGDGNVDIVSTGYYSGTQFLNIRLGAANGTFGANTSIDGPNGSTDGSQAIGLGDFDGDGDLDLIAAGHNGSYSGAGYALNNGTGTFGAFNDLLITNGETARTLKLADIDNDGVIDVLVAGKNGNGGEGQLTVFRSGTSQGVGPLLPFNLTSRAEALQAFTEFDRTLNRLSVQRGKVGAFQSRTGVAVNVLQASSENYKAAESRIRDADIANESANMVRLNILQKASAAVLAQANLQPSLALKLLGHD